MTSKRFRVAFSFAGDKRDYVEKIADLLAKIYGEERIFYDKYYEAELARPDLFGHLKKIYSDQSDLVVVLFSRGSSDKNELFNSEWRAIRVLLAERNSEKVFFGRFDHAELPNPISSDGYVELDDKTPAETARLIIDRLKFLDSHDKDRTAASSSDSFSQVTVPGVSSQNQAQKMDRIVFPAVQFENATLEEAIEYLRVRSWDLDDVEKDQTKRGVNFVLDRDLADNGAALSLDLKKVPMFEALRYITDLADVAYDVGVDKVRIRRKSAPTVKAEMTNPPAAKAKQSAGTGKISIAALSRAQAEGDNPSVEDHFGRERFVETLGYFLTRPKTGTPLTVSIEAPWGAGKTSFMRQLAIQLSKIPDGLEVKRGIIAKSWNWLKERFVRRAPLTMWFNPWRHAEAEAMWAAFALEFARSVRQQSTWARRWCWAPLRLWWQSYDWSGGFPVMMKFVLRLAVLTLAAWGCWWFWHYGSETWANFSESVSQWNKMEEKQKTVAALLEKIITGENGKLVVALVTGIGLVLQLSSALGNPLLPAIRQYLTKQDAAGKLGYVEGFQKQFGQMVRAYAGKRRVFVFVDDLDRCEPSKAANLMQSINLMLGEPDLNAVFLLGMDREKVAAGMAVKHTELLPYLYAREMLGQLDSNGAQIKSVDTLQHLLGLEFGYSFIEKFIQLPFRLPQPGDEGMERYLCNLTGRTYVPGAASRRATQTRYAASKSTVGHENGSGQSMPEKGLNQQPNEPEEVRGAAQKPSAVAARAPNEIYQYAHDALARGRERADRIMRLEMADQLQTEDALFDALLLIRPALDDNPRKLKLALNLLRLHGFLASDWLATPPLPGVPGPRITLTKLAKVIAMDLRWPTYLLSLAEAVSNSQIDEKAPAHQTIAVQDPELTALLERGGGDEILRVADLRAILSVAPAPTAKDSEMIEMVAEEESSHDVPKGRKSRSKRRPENLKVMKKK